MNKSYLIEDFENYIAFFNGLKIWFYNNVLDTNNLEQIFTVVVATFITGLTARPLIKLFRRYFKRKNNRWIPRGFRYVVFRILHPVLLVLTLWFIANFLEENHRPFEIYRICGNLVAAWIVIRTTSVIVRDPLLSRLIAIIAWTISAIIILGYYENAKQFLDSLAFSIGHFTISLMSIVKGVSALILVFWLALNLSRMFERKIQSLTNMDASIKVLSVKIFKIFMIAATFFTVLSISGIDMTAFTVFSGALGVGVGFGLQKVFANFISGIALLIDKSVKPGDVISLSGPNGVTYGWVNSLNSRYISVLTRDGIEHLIPNEVLITSEVVNWSHSNKRVRLKVPFGVSYKSDPRQVIELVMAAIEPLERILKNPQPVCIVQEFGDSSINFQLLFWINDPIRGIRNITSDVYLAIWDIFKTNNIEIPFPQRDLNIKLDGEFKTALQELILETTAKNKK